jgi:hypothetical protein
LLKKIQNDTGTILRLKVISAALNNLLRVRHVANSGGEWDDVAALVFLNILNYIPFYHRQSRGYLVTESL